MDSVQYHQDFQNREIGAMDTTPILQHPNDLDSSFIPSNPLQTSSVAPQLIQQNTPVFSSISEPPQMLTTSLIHVPITDIPQFMSPMEAAPAPHIRPGPPGFLSDLTALNPFAIPPPIESTIAQIPRSLPNSPPLQLSSPSVHETASPFAVGACSLESALEQTIVVTRSRANTSVSPASVPSSYIALPSPTTVLPFVHTEPEPPIVRQEKATANAVETILESIEQTAKHAREMIHQRQDMETGSSIDILHQKINEAALQFSELLVITNSTSSSTSYAPPLHSPLQERQENPLDFTPPPAHTSSTHMDITLSDTLNVSEHPRKRCAPELEQLRSVKAPKREPQDDVPLNLHTPPAVVTQPFNFTPVTHPSIPVKSQIPTSRPPTPPATFSPHGHYSPTKSLTPFPLPTPPIIPQVDFASSQLAAVAPTFPGIHTSWSDSVVPTRHHHSLSSGSVSSVGAPLPTPPIATNSMVDPFTSLSMQRTALPAMPSTVSPSAISPPVGRMSRSGSFNGVYPNTWFPETPSGNWSAQTSPSWFPTVEGQASGPSLSPTSSVASDRPPPTIANTSPNSGEEEDDEDEDDDDDDSNVSKNIHHSSDSPVGLSTNTDIPQEYRADVDRIFFEYLNKICSNLDAADAKGEPIHQRLMAKKMQRLDESLDFRPFKFRIQAFTMAFLEELASRGYPEEKIPMKKVRNYLWRQQYILRFNEDGKKAKSKGNHIWNIEAKKLGNDKWEFRPFHRKLAGTPPPVAYVGLKWSWQPHVWDPQASWINIPVEYTSPLLPPWLSWSDDILSGIPPPDAEDCRITVIANYTLDGQDGQLSHTFQITIAPAEPIEVASLARSRRSSLASDPPKRSTSDSVLVQGVQRAKPRPLPARRSSPESPDTRVIRVLQSVAQRVTVEARSQISQSPPKHLQELAIQKQVLEHSVTAYDKAIAHAGDNPNRRLAVAAQNVVVQAAHNVIADRAVANGIIPQQHSEVVAIKSVTVMELSDATQGAIAAAVKQKGRDSTEVDIMVAAGSILKSRTTTVEPAAGSQPVRSSGTVVASRIMPKIPTYTLPPVSEYV